MTATDPPAIPAPPLDLLQRTGNVGDQDPFGAYLHLGLQLRAHMEAILPRDWRWKGKRVLDFGCGAGRVLRHFAEEANEGEFCGCDIDAASIEWVERNMCPPFQAFVCGEEAGLPHPDGYFDFIFAWSVYTHITDHWAEWLLEHHRVLADDGLLFATFLGEGMIAPVTGEQWCEDLIGMNMIHSGNPWDLGGPSVLLSPWWLRAHWGRAFEILDLWPYTAPEPRRPTAEDPPTGHGMILLRRKPVRLTVEDLMRLEPAEPREILALQHNVHQLRNETSELRRQHALIVDQLTNAQEALREIPALKQQLASRDAELRATQDALQRQRAWLDGIQESLSWRLTAPARTAKRRLRSAGTSLRDITRR